MYIETKKLVTVDYYFVLTQTASYFILSIEINRV